jgi:alpha-L-fucosidase
MKKLIVALFFSCTFLSAQETIKPTWESINARPYPKWFKDAKLGVFIHWGLYSVPAYSGKEDYAEWFLRGLQLNDSLRTNFTKNTFGQNFTYKDFAPLFKAELFNPEEWATLFKNAGAKYVMLVTKHHDGYALWPSKYSRNWNSVDVGPKRNIVGELTTAVRNTNLKMGMYYSLAEWNHPLHRWYTDPNDSIANYVENYMIPQFKELVSTYKPSLIFADGEWLNSAKQWHAKELISWYYNLVGEEAIVNNRWGSGSNTGFLTPEYSAGIKETSRPWAEVRGLGRSFGLNRYEDLEAYMSSKELIHFFIKAVANGGGMIINVGPKADGQIPLLQQERLLALGKWLKVNGEAIYGSTPWTKTGEEIEISKVTAVNNLDFNWVRNTPIKPIKEDNFAATYVGYIQPNYSENYTFEALADDGVRVWVDNKLIINNWKKVEADEGNVMGANTAVSNTGTIKLSANKRHTIKVDYYEEKQNAHLQLFWKSKSEARNIVPSANLFLNSKGNEKGLLAEYTSLYQHIAYTQNNGNLYLIVLNWPADKLEIECPNFKTGAKVTLLGNSQVIPFTYTNNKLVIDVTNFGYHQVPDQEAWVFKIPLK